MGEKQHKIAISNNKLTITPNDDALLGPLYTLIERYLNLNETEQKKIDELLESLLKQKKSYTKSFSISSEQSTFNNDFFRTIKNLKTKKDRILYIAKHRANPLFLSARDIQELYEHYLYPEKIGISTIQTNLNRLTEAGFVERREGDPIEYRVNPLRIKDLSQILMD